MVDVQGWKEENNGKRLGLGQGGAAEGPGSQSGRRKPGSSKGELVKSPETNGSDVSSEQMQKPEGEATTTCPG